MIDEQVVIRPGDFVIATDAGGKDWAAIAETPVVQGRDMPVVTVYFHGQGAIPWPAESVRPMDAELMLGRDGASGGEESRREARGGGAPDD